MSEGQWLDEDRRMATTNYDEGRQVLICIVCLESEKATWRRKLSPDKTQDLTV